MTSKYTSNYKVNVGHSFVFDFIAVMLTQTIRPSVWGMDTQKQQPTPTKNDKMSMKIREIWDCIQI